MPNGLIELEVNQIKEALRSTYINALLLPKGGKQVLNHLDTISFGSQSIMLFKYPKLRRIGDAFAQAIREASEGISPEELEEQTRQKLEAEGLFGAIEGGYDGNVDNLI